MVDENDNNHKDKKMTVSQNTKVFNKGISVLRNEEERLIKLQQIRERSEQNIIGDKYKLK